MRKTSKNVLIDYMAKVIKENEKFLREKKKDAFSIVVEMVNDAIDYTMFVVKRWKDHPINCTIFFFILHILMPSSYAILADLLIGNLPACFMELRLMLESLAKCYVADLYPEKNLFFEEKLLCIRTGTKRRRNKHI